MSEREIEERTAALPQQMSLIGAAERFVAWARDAALPFWAAQGQNAAGAFAERIGQAGTPLDEPIRARVQPRQIASFAQARLIDWQGPWRQALEAGLAFYTKHFFKDDGTTHAKVNPDGRVVDKGFDLYDQAFALYAYAEAARADMARRAVLEERALKLIKILRRRHTHLKGGFEEAPPSPAPLRANPHMHLLEAALSWEANVPDPVWRDLADEIADLALTRLIDPETGALSEFFDAGWHAPAAPEKRIVEPGHQFEWAWLLARWGAARGKPQALSAAGRLFEIGEAHGIDGARGVCIMALDGTFRVRDPIARLWGQTEWIKAALLLAQLCDDSADGRAARQAYEASAARGALALSRFLDTPTPGLWRDKLTAENRFIDEPAPASSLYHIMGAILALKAQVGV